MARAAAGLLRDPLEQDDLVVPKNGVLIIRKLQKIVRNVGESNLTHPPNKTMFMTMNQVMINLSEAKTHLSKYARIVKQGGRVVLCDRNVPFAEIRPLSVDVSGRRPFGLAAGLIDVPDDFNTPDPEIEALFSRDMAT